MAARTPEIVRNEHGWWLVDGVRMYGPFPTEQDAKQCDPSKPGQFLWMEAVRP